MMESITCTAPVNIAVIKYCKLLKKISFKNHRVVVQFKYVDSDRFTSKFCVADKVSNFVLLLKYQNHIDYFHISKLHTDYFHISKLHWKLVNSEKEN